MKINIYKGIFSNKVSSSHKLDLKIEGNEVILNGTIIAYKVRDKETIEFSLFWLLEALMKKHENKSLQY